MRSGTSVEVPRFGWYVVEMRVAIAAAMLIGIATAHAQPGNPNPNNPTPTPAPAPPPQTAEDAVLAEQIAQSLVSRAQELFDAKLYLDAKQLAVEALVKSPNGQAAAQAKFVINSVNTALGIKDDKPVDTVDTTPITDPLKDKPVVTPPLAEGNVVTRPRLMISGAVWGAIVGGLLADAASVDNTKASHVAIGAGVGGGLGALAGYGLSKTLRQTKGDVALMDTLAGIGGVGGLTVGMLMQPVEGEAYNVNAMIGIAAGLLVGYVAAPQTNTTERRMLRVAGMSLAGGALPFLLYAGIYDKTTDSDERLVGGLSTAGLLAGAFVGFRLTRNLDAGQDVLPGGQQKPEDDAPVALFGRHSDGRWTANGIGLTPLSRALAPQQGMSLALVSGAF